MIKNKNSQSKKLSILAVASLSCLIPGLMLGCSKNSQEPSEKADNLVFSSNITVGYSGLTHFDDYKTVDNDSLFLQSNSEVFGSNLKKGEIYQVSNPSFKPIKGTSSYFLRAKLRYFSVQREELKEITDSSRVFSVKPEFSSSWLESKDGYFYNVNSGVSSWTEGDNLAKLHINYATTEEDGEQVLLFDTNSTSFEVFEDQVDYELVAVQVVVDAVEATNPTEKALSDFGWSFKNLYAENLKLSFDLDNGEGRIDDVVSITEGTTISLSNFVASKKGYEFLGWSVNGQIVDEVTFKDEDITVKAVYKIKDLKLSFDVDGADSGIGDEVYHIGDEAILNKKPSKTGYRFDYWTIDGERVDSVKFDDKDITVKAHYTKGASVSFVVRDQEGVSGLSQIIYGYKGETITFPEVTKDEGKILRWILSSTGEVFEGNSIYISEDLEGTEIGFTALISEIITVKYYSNGVEVDSVEYDSYDEYVISNRQYTETEDSTVYGWKEEDEDRVYLSGEKVKFSKNTNLIPVRANVVFYYDNEGEKTLQDLAVVIRDGKIVVPECVIKRFNNYEKFVNWEYEVNNETKHAKPFDEVDFVEGLRFKAQFEEYSPVAKIDLNGGIILNQYQNPIEEEISINKNVSEFYLNLSGYTFEKVSEGKTYGFVGFKVTSDVDEELNVALSIDYMGTYLVVAKSEGNILGNLTLTAVWEENLIANAEFVCEEGISITDEETSKVHLFVYNAKKSQYGIYSQAQLFMGHSFDVKYDDQTRLPVFTIYDSLGNLIEETMGLDDLINNPHYLVPGGIKIFVSLEETYNLHVSKGEIEGIEIDGEEFDIVYSEHNKPNLKVLPFKAEGYSVIDIEYYDENQNHVDVWPFEGDLTAIPVWIKIGFFGGSLEIDGETIYGEISGTPVLSVNDFGIYLPTNNILISLRNHDEYRLAGWKLGDFVYSPISTLEYKTGVYQLSEEASILCDFANKKFYYVTEGKDLVELNSEQINLSNLYIVNNTEYERLIYQYNNYEQTDLRIYGQIDGEEVSWYYLGMSDRITDNLTSEYGALKFEEQNKLEEASENVSINGFSQRFNVFTLSSGNKIYNRGSKYFFVESEKTFEEREELKVFTDRMFDGGEYERLMLNGETVAFIYDLYLYETAIVDESSSSYLVADENSMYEKELLQDVVFEAVWQETIQIPQGDKISSLFNKDEFNNALEEMNQLYLDAFGLGLYNDLSDVSYNHSIYGELTFEEFLELSLEDLDDFGIYSPKQMMSTLNELSQDVKIVIKDNAYYLYSEAGENIFVIKIEKDEFGVLSRFTLEESANITAKVTMDVSGVKVTNPKKMTNEINAESENYAEVVEKLDQGIAKSFIPSEDNDLSNALYFVSFDHPEFSFASVIDISEFGAMAEAHLINENEAIKEIKIEYSEDESEYHVATTLMENDEEVVVTRIYIFEGDLLVGYSISEFEDFSNFSLKVIDLGQE